MDSVNDYVTGLRQRWSIWHSAMTLLSACFFFEMSIIFGELYWWKYTGKPGSITGLVTDQEFADARIHHLNALAAEFAVRLGKYSWYAALLGFGMLGNLWRAFSSMPFFKRHLERKDSKLSKSIVGGVFYAAFQIINQLLLPLLIIMLVSLATWTSPLATLAAHFTRTNMVWNFINPLIYVTVMTILEVKLSNGAYLLSWLFDAALFLVGLPIYIWILRSNSLQIVKTANFPAGATIVALCKQVGFDPNHAYLQTGGINAYFIGFGSLSSFFILSGIFGLELRQMVAVAAHELGHWYWMHSVVGIVSHLAIAGLNIGLFWVFRQRHWYKEFVNISVPNPLEVPLGLSLVIFTVIFVPVEVIIKMLMNLLSWWKEIAADNFAVSYGYGPDLILALANMSKGFVEKTYRSPIYGLFYKDHPPLNVRFNLIRGGGVFQ